MSKVNPNLLIAGGIIGLVTIGGVILWRALDPRLIPEKLKSAFDENFDKYYTKTDPTTGKTTPDTRAIALSTMSPLYGIYNYLKKRNQED